MNESWSTRRRLAYAGAVIMLLTLVFVYAYRETLFPNPTCFDGKQNAFESGIDCGGECSLRCFQDVMPLSVSWARAVRASSSTYDLIASVSNKNVNNAPERVSYSFIVYDSEGKEMKRMEGNTIVPLGDFPVIVQNVSFPSSPRNVSLVLSADVPHFKVSENPVDPVLKVSDPVYESQTIPRVYAKVTNTKRQVFRNLRVRTLLYDAEGNAFAGGETVIPELGKEETKNIVFTWNVTFPNPPVKVRVIPILDPFLNSD